MEVDGAKQPIGSHVTHLRNHIATTVVVAALGIAGAACTADDAGSPGQEEGVTDVVEQGDDSDDSGGLGY